MDQISATAWSCLVALCPFLILSAALSSISCALLTVDDGVGFTFTGIASVGLRRTNCAGPPVGTPSVTVFNTFGNVVNGFLTTSPTASAASAAAFVGNGFLTTSPAASATAFAFAAASAAAFAATLSAASFFSLFLTRAAVAAAAPESAAFSPPEKLSVNILVGLLGGVTVGLGGISTSSPVCVFFSSSNIFRSSSSILCSVKEPFARPLRASAVPSRALEVLPKSRAPKIAAAASLPNVSEKFPSLVPKFSRASANGLLIA